MEKSKQIISPRNQFNWMPEIELKELGICKHPKPADKTSIGYDLYVPRGIFIEPPFENYRTDKCFTELASLRRSES